ncbi:MAG TPA: LPXTG cell wall anchor domain-containing protein [Micromonosporaceae bacterium]|nr:LPXTG cell wall anchor domain-containing protein [Micromonosporaceae bacterium]
MASRWLTRLAFTVVAGGVALLAAATPALANTTVLLRQSNVLANGNSDKGFGKCTTDQAANEDIWVFVWPGNNAGDLVDLTLNFASDGGFTADSQRTEADATKTLDNGTLKVSVSTPAGWRLINGTSVVTGTVPGNDDEFNLTHTCAGTPGSTPPTTPSDGGSSSSDGGGGDGGSSTPPSGSGGLPVTGTAIGGIVVVGIGMLAAGVALMAVRRRRDLTDLTDV